MTQEKNISDTFQKRNNPSKLRVKREALGLRTCDVAERMGVNVYTYRRWERGEHKPQSRWKQSLCTFFQCEMHDLF
jgi:DNA-binding XRE family transcriptional regulator